MWFTETAWPPILICLVLAGLAFALSSRWKQRTLLTVALVLVLDCPLFWLVERAIVTTLEQQQDEIGRNIADLAAAVERNDKAAATAFFSDDLPALRTAVESGMAMVDLQDVTVKHLEIKRLDDKTLQSQFRANANVTVNNVGAGANSFPTRWKLDWQQKQGKWVIIAITRMHPVREEEVPLLDVRQ